MAGTSATAMTPMGLSGLLKAMAFPAIAIVGVVGGACLSGGPHRSAEVPQVAQGAVRAVADKPTLHATFVSHPGTVRH